MLESVFSSRSWSHYHVLPEGKNPCVLFWQNLPSWKTDLEGPSAPLLKQVHDCLGLRVTRKLSEVLSSYKAVTTLRILLCVTPISQPVEESDSPLTKGDLARVDLTGLGTA